MAKDDTPADSDTPYEAYWTKLGRLIHYQSLVEALLVQAAHHFAGVSAEIGNAFAPELRADGAKAVLNRVLQSVQLDGAAERLTPVLAQFSAISDARNKLVHWGALRDGEADFLVTSAKRVTSLNLTEFRISLRDLDAIHLDLFRIGMHLMLEIRGDDPDSEWEPVLAGPWLYKPAQRHRPNQPKRTAHSRSSK